MPVTVGGFLALLKPKVAPGHNAILPVEGFLRIFAQKSQKSAKLNFSQNVATAITHVPGVPFFALTRTVPALRAAPSK